MADIPGDDPIIEDQSQLPDPLPIFPLPNVVLMPNASLPLYIFEERYKEMVRDCLAGEPYLSVALLQKGWEKQPGTPRPYPVAGFGRIARAVRRPNDCMDIVIQGMGRIEMLEFHDDRAYLCASVRTLSPTPADQAPITQQAEAMRQQFSTCWTARGSPPTSFAPNSSCSPARSTWFSSSPRTCPWTRMRNRRCCRRCRSRNRSCGSPACLA